MNPSDNINFILKKIIENQQTDDDSAELRKLVGDYPDGKIVLTVSEGKNIVGKIIGDRIQVGDRTINTKGGNYHEDRSQIENSGTYIRQVLRDYIQIINLDNTSSSPPIPPEKLPEAICDFLADIEAHFKYIRLFHTPQKIILKEQYIPIQVTLERIYRHEVESIGYPESEEELKQAYALKHQEETRRTQVDWQEAKAEHQRLVILADPGMGKSTLLKIEALSTAQEQLDQLSQQQITVDEVVLPLFVRLSELAKDKVEILELMPQLMRRDYPRSFPGLEQFLTKQINDGKYLLLLDALDEVPIKQRKLLIEKLQRFTRKDPGQIYGTSRIVGYGGTLLDDAKEVEIVPFNSQQTEDYIKTWFANAQGYLEDESVSAEALIQELQHKPQIQGLAQNPLLLSLLCSLYQEKKLKLPARRGEVYAQAVAYMLEKWRNDNHRPIQNQENDDYWIDIKRECLEFLAYDFSSHSQEIFSARELRAKIKIFDPTNSHILFKELCEEDGIIQKLNPETDRYLFLHRTFQEYLTAVYLKQQIEHNLQEGMDLVKRHFWEYDWHETLTLLAGLLDDPIPLLKAITKEPDDIFHSLLLLAGRCVAECQPQTDPIFSQIMDEIYGIWWGDPPKFAYMESTIEAIGQSHSRICHHLQSALHDFYEYVRRYAVEALGNIGNAQAVLALMDALQDSNLSVRSKAAEALGKIGSPEAVAGLIAGLHDSNLSVRSKAAEALGKIGSPEAVAGLIAGLHDSNLSVRSKAAEALGKIGSPEAVAGLIAGLQHSEWNVRYYAAEALGKIGSPEAVPGLIAALHDFYEDVRYYAAEALGKIGSPEAVPGLIAALHDSDENVRYYAAEALGKIGSPEAVAGLIAALHDSDEDVRYYAAEALGKIGNSEAVAGLIAALHDSDEDVRRNAVSALGNTGSSEAVAGLIAALHDSDEYVTKNAAAVLGKIGSDEAVAGLIAALHDSDDEYIGSDEAVTGLIAALHDSDEYVRRNAVSALGKIGSSEAVAGLIAALHDSDEDVRRNAVSALGNTGSSEAVAGLIAALHDSDEDVRRNAVKALGNTGNSEAVAGLIAALHDSDEDVRRNAVKALGNIGNSEAVPGLIAALQDSDYYFRRYAVEALGKISDVRILKQIVKSHKIDIFDRSIFLLARKLAIKFHKEKDRVDFIPVYEDVVN